MASNNQFLNTTELDFETLKSALKTFMKGQKAFEDYDFEGSNLSALIDLLTYNTHLNAQYLNMVASEAYLDSSILREPVVSNAKELNYVPRSKISSRVPITINIEPSDTPDFITIPKHYKIYSKVDKAVLTYTCEESIVIQNSDGVYSSPETYFYEGEIVKEIFTASPTYDDEGNIMTYIYPLSSENLDYTSIEVSVQNSSSDTKIYTYTKKDSLFGIRRDDRIFFVEGYRDNRYQLVFGNDVLGKALSDGNIVTVTYRDTVGGLGDGSTTFSRSGEIDGYDDISVQASLAAFGGSERESINSIKYNAPRYFQTQERAVTGQDFVTLTKTKFPEIQSVVSYGGEEDSPPQYGKVIVSVKPHGSIGNISNSLKTQIKEYLKLKSLTTEPIIKDPEFFYVSINSTVYYNKDLTTKAAGSIATEVIAKIKDYDTTELTAFNKDVRYSKIVANIDSVDESIVSNDTNMEIIKRWSPLTNTEENQKLAFSFGQALDDSELIPFYSNTFKYTYNGTDYDSAFFEDDKLGKIHVKLWDNSEKIILDKDVGTINYTTGEIYIATKINEYTNYIKLYAKTLNRDILASQNRFLIIDFSDIKVNIQNYLD